MRATSASATLVITTAGGLGLGRGAAGLGVLEEVSPPGAFTVTGFDGMPKVFCIAGGAVR